MVFSSFLNGLGHQTQAQLLFAHFNLLLLIMFFCLFFLLFERQRRRKNHYLVRSVFVVMFYHFGFIGWFRIRRRKRWVDEWLYKCCIHHAGKKPFQKEFFSVVGPSFFWWRSQRSFERFKRVVYVHPAQLKLSRNSLKALLFLKT